jgi:acetyl-CoA C-acetyltransferase
VPEVAIVSAVRTPIGSFGGALKDISAVELGAAVVSAALSRADLPAAEVDQVIMGNVLQAGLGQNPARQAALRAGLPAGSTAWTVNMVCGSGLKAVLLGAQSIMAGEAQIVVAGGMESMSNAPYTLPGLRWGRRMGGGEADDCMIRDGLWCAVGDYHMGVTAENVAARYGVTRADQDAFALQSQRRASAALSEDRFAAEIVPVPLPPSKGAPAEFRTDEHPRPTVTAAALAKLKPAFRPDGTVTAGNASGINDAAAALVLMSVEKCKSLGLEYLAVLRGGGEAGVAPEFMGIGPVPAVRKALRQAELAVADLDLIEANEAFAAQTIAVARELGFSPAVTNVNGGAIALGHPIGASGARILVTLLHEMKRRQSRFGLAALCVGGGQGIAAVMER